MQRKTFIQSLLTLALAASTTLATAQDKPIEWVVGYAAGGGSDIVAHCGDTSVLGWQVMALRSAELAGLTVPPQALEGAKRWLRSRREVRTPASRSSGTGCPVRARRGRCARRRMPIVPSKPPTTRPAQPATFHLPRPET